VPTIKFPEGTTFRQQYTIQDSEGTAINLNGAFLEFAVYLQNRPKTGVQPTVLNPKDNQGQGDIFVKDPPNGVVVISFHPHETVDLAGTYDWEMQLNEADGDKWLAGRGTLLIQPARRLDPVLS
jgi:hypothetical protein